MARLIELTKPWGGESVWVNPDYVARVDGGETGSTVTFKTSGYELEVKESPEEIREIIAGNDSDSWRRQG